MHLRLLTYNIHRAIGVDRRFRPERIVGVLEHHDADVVLLQEVDDGVPRSREIDMARQLASMLNYPHYVVGHNVSLRTGRYGNATLSRHPILAERNIDLTVGDRKRRGCQHTRILLEGSGWNGTELDVFNLHLGLSATERARQIGLLARAPEFAQLDRQRACVVGGDFNDWRSLLPPIFTDVLTFQCVSSQPGKPQSAIRTYPSFSPRGSLDRLYVRGPLKMISARACRLRVSRVASDHLPLIADLELG